MLISLFQAVVSEKQCIIYSWGRSSAFQRPFFSPEFINDVRVMSVFESPTIEDPYHHSKMKVRRLAGSRFIRIYGTHVFDEVNFGSAFRSENFYKLENKTSVSQGSAEKCHERAVSGCASASLGVGGIVSFDTELCVTKKFNECLKNSSNSEVKINILDNNVSLATLGALYDRNMAIWIERTKLSPRVVSATLIPMQDILNPKYFTESITYGIRGFINVTNALEVFKETLAYPVHCGPGPGRFASYRIHKQENKCKYLN